MNKAAAEKLFNKKIPAPGYPKCVGLDKNKKVILVKDAAEERKWRVNNPKEAEKLDAPQKAYKLKKAEKKARIAKEKMANLASFVDK